MAALINKQKIPSVHAHRTLRLGMPTSSKMDEFSEKFQTAFDLPPLIFGKLCGLDKQEQIGL